MSRIFAKAKSKTRKETPSNPRVKSNGKRTLIQPTRPKNPQAKAFYSAPPTQTLTFPIQPKVAIGRLNDPYECEADAAADRVVAGQSVTSVSTLPPGGLSAPAQRQEDDPEDRAQTMPLQRKEDDGTDEAAQTGPVQRQEDEEIEETAETAQTIPIQRHDEEGNVETAQSAPLQLQTEESEDTAQALSVQRQEAEESEESTQAAFVQEQEDEGTQDIAQTAPLQRQKEEPEDTAQTLSLQRQEEPEDPTQTHAIQRQEDEGTDETAQTFSVQRQDEDGADEAVQEMTVQLESEEDTIQERAAGALGPPATEGMRSAAAHAIHSRGPGEPLNPETRQRLESSQGVDLSEVRVHEDSSARQASGALKARAFTHKNHIWLGHGQSQSNVRLMAHETTHVLQQGGVVRRKPVDETEEEKLSEEDSGGIPKAKEERKGVTPEPTLTSTLVPPIEKTREPKSPLPEGTEAVPGTAVVTNETAEPIKAGKPQGEKEAAFEEKAAGDKKPEVASEIGTSAMPGSAEKAVEEVPAAPAPEEDAKFQAVMGRLEKHSGQEKSHEPAIKKVAAARAAAVPPENDRSSRAQANQVEVMDKQEAKKPAKDDFLSMLRKALDAIAPKNMEETEEFKKKGKTGQLKATLNKKVDQQKEDSSKDIKSATATEPDPKTVEAKEVSPIPADPANPPKPSLRSKEILPDPKSNSDISMEHNKQKADQLMAENDIDEEQLERANEPQFSDALKAKKELDKHADKVPLTYREEEQGYLDKAKGEVATEEKSTKSAMRAKRNRGKSQVKTRQQEAEKKEEAERKKVADRIQSMYQTTKKKVEDKLNSLDADVNKLFDDGEKGARDRFESYVDRRMAGYKWDRYLNKFGGGALWLKDKIMGMPDEVNRFYEEGRERYIKDMDVVLVKIAETVESRLKEAKDEIAKGKKQIKEYIDELPKNLKKAGKEAEKNVSSQFDELEEGVESKKEELAQSMAKQYRESRKKLDDRIEELKKENQGLVDDFIGKIKQIIEILRNFKNRVMSLMKQGGDALRKIVKDPGKFLDNLGAALKKGFNQFTGNFLKHLKAAFINWLFGTMSKAGIEIPSEFSFKGVFGIILQVIGISKDWIRSRIVKHIGAKNVDRIEKAWSIVSTMISGGIGGLWEKAKEFLGDLKDKLFDTIQNWLITQIVKQAVIWVLSLLNPVSALLKIIKMIYDVIMFFVENIDRILQLVEAVIQSVAKIVAGNIGAAANWIENAMARILPIIISFLARLLGIGGIADKIKSFIKKTQKKVRGVVDKVLKRIVKGITKIIGKGKRAVKNTVKRVKELLFPKKKFKIGEEMHTVAAARSRKGHEILIHSPGSRFEDWINEKKKAAASNPKLKKDIADLETEYGKWKAMKVDTDMKKIDKTKKYLVIFKKMADIEKASPTKSTVPMSKIEWKPLKGGRAYGVKADPLTVNGPPGSEASGFVPGWEPSTTDLKGQKVAAIRAHLLHYDLHGPGKGFNLTPTSDRMNKLMFHNVEKPALKALGIRYKQTTPKSKKLTYETTVSYAQRPPKKELKNVAKHIKMVAKDKDTGAEIGKLDGDNY